MNTLEQAKGTIAGPACTVCGSNTELYIWPAEFAGIIQCLNADCAASTNCEHESTHIESIDDIDGDHTFPAHICDDCDVMIDTVDADEEF